MPSLDFPETSYGDVKRVKVFWEWLESFRARRGDIPLSILDFGCGTGVSVTLPLAQGEDCIHGVDMHEPSIVLAQKQNHMPNVSFCSESTKDLLTQGSQYDVIICSEVLEHIYNPADYLRDFHCLLVPDGLLFVTVPNGYGSFENLRRMEKILNRFGVGYMLDHLSWPARTLKWRLKGKGLPPCPGQPEPVPDRAAYLNLESGHVQFFSLQEITQLFTEAGFTVEISRGRTLLCGPYVDFWLRYFSLGGLLLRLNNDLADRLPLHWAADWMFCLRKTNRL